MEQKKLNRNALRSKRLIRKAFLELIQEKPYQEISITDIVNLADINRATFYAHYACIRNIVEEIENEITENLMGILSEFKFDNFFTDPLQLLLRVSAFFAEDIEYYKTLVAVAEARDFIDRLTDIFTSYMMNDVSIPESLRNSKSFTLRICFFAGGMTSMYLQWFRGKLNCTLQDIPLEICNVLYNSCNDTPELRSIRQRTAPARSL